MKKNIVYLFGAGASANAMPVVKFFNKRLELFLKFLETKRHIAGFADFIQDVLTILEESKNHSTIDTVAKKFFHSYSHNKDKLNKLKKVLMLFFLYEQQIDDAIIKNRNWHTPNEVMEKERIETGNKTGMLDKRYDSFLAALLRPIEDNFVFPDEVGVITWNYDCQFELALKQFTNEPMYDLQKRLNVYPLLPPTSDKSYWNKINTSEFKILHLNGQAHNYYQEKNQPLKSFIDSQEPIENIIEKALKFIDFKNLTFSWEANSTEGLQYEEIKTVIDASVKLIKRSKVLVIIGYSFPFFNRDVDKLLFSEKDFDKIYIQDSNAENLKDLFINVFRPKINDQDIIEYKNLDQFLLPAELDTDFKNDDDWFLKREN